MSELTHKEIGEQLGFTQKQVKKFIERYHRKERKLAAGMGQNYRHRYSN